MTLEKKLLKLAVIFEDSELIQMVEKHFDEETAQEMILELKKEIINLLEQ